MLQRRHVTGRSSLRPSEYFQLDDDDDENGM